MAKHDESNTEAISRQFRNVSGLPDRKNDKPTDPSKPSQLRRQAEPEGGYDQRGEEERDEGVMDEKFVKELQDGEELSAKSGQGVTDGTDASTSTEATEASQAAAGKSKTPAKKTAAKKTAAKKTAKKS